MGEYAETVLKFEVEHMGKKALNLRCTLPGKDAPEILLDVPKSAPHAQIGGPRHGGTHKGHNGAFQSFYATSVKCTQKIAPWGEDDMLEVGDNEHYAPLGRWDFTALVKAYSTDFKICAYKPTGWISGKDAAAAVEQHEMQLKKGVKGGAL